jgi:hypothetical protein
MLQTHTGWEPMKPRHQLLSVFLGTEVSKMLDLMEEAVVDRKMTPDEKTALKLNIGRIPEIILDSTDETVLRHLLLPATVLNSGQ